MNKYLVEVYVPANGVTYDIKVPSFVSVYQITRMVALMIGNQNSGDYIPTEDAVLCFQNDGRTVPMNLSVSKAGIENGTKLLLI